MSEKLLVVIAGQPGSGKTTLTRELVRQYGFDSRNIGDELARLYRLEHGLAADAPVDGLERMPIHKQVRRTDPDYFTRFCIEGDYTRRAIDGMRNLHDARNIVESGGFVISLVAPQAVRFDRRAADTEKDANRDALALREYAENSDTDVDGAQTEEVMKLASDHGFYVDASHNAHAVLNDTLAGFKGLGVDLGRPNAGQQG